MLEGDNNQPVGILSWAGEVKKMLFELGFEYLCNNQSITRLQLQQVVQRLYDHYIQSWYNCFNNSSKLSAYRTVKTQFYFKKYLTCIQNTISRELLFLVYDVRHIN